LFKIGCFDESNYKAPNSVLLLGLIATGCTVGMILMSFDVIVLTVMGTSKVDLATNGRV
jgi:hypothetical protein